MFNSIGHWASLDEIVQAVGPCIASIFAIRAAGSTVLVLRRKEHSVFPLSSPVFSR